MKHLSEHIIEQYIFEDINQSITIQKINAHLSECQECHRVYHWLRTFYEEFESLPYESSDLLGMAQMNTSTLRLTPFESANKRGYAPPEPLVLAARSKPSYSRFQHLVTLQTGQEEVLVRILYDDENHRYQLFVVSDSNYNPASILIQLPICPEELLTDEKGRASFRSEKSRKDIQWSNLNGILRFPIEQCRISDHALSEVRSRDSFHFTDNKIPLEIGYKEDSREYVFNFSNRSDIPKPSRMVLIPDSGDHKVYHLSELTAIVQERDLITAEPCTVGLYK